MNLFPKIGLFFMPAEKKNCAFHSLSTHLNILVEIFNANEFFNKKELKNKSKSNEYNRSAHFQFDFI